MLFVFDLLIVNYIGRKTTKMRNDLTSLWIAWELLKGKICCTENI